VNWLRPALQVHKWLGLVVGLQVLAWVAGGLVMTALPIERVRSEHHLRKPAPAPLPPGLITAEAAARLSKVSGPTSLQLKSAPVGPVWVVRGGGEVEFVLDARTGAPLGPLSAVQARRLAALAYVGDGRPISARYFAQPPRETGRETPLWRVDFDDAERTAFYLAPETGEVVVRRSNVWRFYDFFWRLHILDFKTGENFNHPLIVTLAALSLPMAVAGLILLWLRLRADLRRALRRRGQRETSASHSSSLST
jgi:uncharacterized iron-regulated membrane protein